MGILDIRLDDLIDCIVPRIERQTPQAKRDYEKQRADARAEWENLVAGIPSNEEHLKDYLETVKKLVEKEQSRRTGVETRLTSIVGLTSIAATVVLTALFAMAAGSMPLQQDVAKWILVPGCFYLALQLYIGLHQAVKGLSRAPYDADTAVDILPSAQMARCVFLRRCISNKFNMLEQHREKNNEKVTRLAVAHCAVRNFLFVLLILAAAASWMAFTREQPKEAVVSSDKLNAVQATPPRKIVLMKIAIVGPFPDGDHLLSQETVLSCVREALKPYGDIQFSGWQIIGRVDKRQLRKDRATIYGSNQALAMARAVWVTDYVLSQIASFDPATAIVSVGGARSIGAKVGDSERRLDRAVDIYALFDREIRLINSSKPPTETRTIVCP